MNQIALLSRRAALRSGGLRRHVVCPEYRIVNPATGLVNVLPASIAGVSKGAHQTGINFRGPLPAGCQLDKACLGTYHFTVHRVRANMPNAN